MRLKVLGSKMVSQVAQKKAGAKQQKQRESQQSAEDSRALQKQIRRTKAAMPSGSANRVVDAAAHAIAVAQTTRRGRHAYGGRVKTLQNGQDESSDA